jgi:hypothetical protein
MIERERQDDALTLGQGLPRPEEGTPLPWEMIDQGRYMPRRIRGSFRGRELG